MPHEDGIAGAFVGLKRELQRLVRRFVRPADIEDIVQETFVRAFEAERERPIRHPRAFMLQTAKNLALNHLARSDQKLVDSMEDFVDSAVFSGSDGLDVQLDSRERFHAFCRAVRDLPLQCRRAFILKKVYGLSQREIAEYLGIAESTVEKHVAKGMLHCWRVVEAYDAGATPQQQKRTEESRHG
jgi:RNA polymerase sigma-70 factor (ECF subfamily)